MAPSPKQTLDAKPRKSMKTTPGWPSLTPRQRQVMLDNSPILSRLLNLLAPLLWR